MTHDRCMYFNKIIYLQKNSNIVNYMLSSLNFKKYLLVVSLYNIN